MGAYLAFAERARRALTWRGRGSSPIGRDRIHLVVCVSVAYEARLLPHYLAHYLALGIQPKNFHVIVNAAAKVGAPEYAVLDVLDDYGIAAEEIWREPYTSDSMWQKRRDVQRRCVPKDHWVISADLDEFHEYPMALDVFLGECEANGVTYVDGVFIDRVSSTGELAEIPTEQSLEERFPIHAMVQGKAVGYGQYHRAGGSIKMMAFNAALLPNRGGHGPVQPPKRLTYLFGHNLSPLLGTNSPWVRFRVPLRVHHFKWHAGLLETLERRIATPGVSPAGEEYANALLSYFGSNGKRVSTESIPVDNREAAKNKDKNWRLKVSVLRYGNLCLEPPRIAKSMLKPFLLRARFQLRGY